MPHEFLVTQPAGPLILIGVRPPEAYEKNGVAKSISCIGLIDTGASSTAISPIAARKAGLIPSDLMLVLRGGKPIQVPAYAARVRFQGHEGESGWQDLTLAGAAPASPGVEVLIGRDMLAWVTMLYDGPKNSVVLLF